MVQSGRPEFNGGFRSGFHLLLPQGLAEGSTMATIRISLLAFLAVGLLSAQATFDRMIHANKEPQNWLTYSGTYSGTRYSPLAQINRDNVKDLQLKWVYRPSYTKTRNNQSKM